MSNMRTIRVTGKGQTKQGQAGHDSHHHVLVGHLPGVR